MKRRIEDILSAWLHKLNLLRRYNQNSYDLKELFEAYGRIDPGLSATDLIDESSFVLGKFADSGMLTIKGSKGEAKHWGQPFDNLMFTFNASFSRLQPNLAIDDERYHISIKPPIEIQESLLSFDKDHPDPSKTAFVMMHFGKTRAHQEIVNAVTISLESYDIKGVRADQREYHPELYYNVLTYIYGCGFGIAIYERIEAELFSPNVSLEVGYMFALNKPVCLLKDKTLRGLHTDIVGKLYKEFDPKDSMGTIPPEVGKWLSDRSLIHDIVGRPITRNSASFQ